MYSRIQLQSSWNSCSWTTNWLHQCSLPRRPPLGRLPMFVANTRNSVHCHWTRFFVHSNSKNINPIVRWRLFDPPRNSKSKRRLWKWNCWCVSIQISLNSIIASHSYRVVRESWLFLLSINDRGPVLSNVCFSFYAFKSDFLLSFTLKKDKGLVLSWLSSSI